MELCSSMARLGTPLTKSSVINLANDILSQLLHHAILNNKRIQDETQRIEIGSLKRSVENAESEFGLDPGSIIPKTLQNHIYRKVLCGTNNVTPLAEIESLIVEL